MNRRFWGVELFRRCAGVNRIVPAAASSGSRGAAYWQLSLTRVPVAYGVSGELLFAGMLQRSRRSGGGSATPHTVRMTAIGAMLTGMRFKIFTIPSFLIRVGKISKSKGAPRGLNVSGGGNDGHGNSSGSPIQVQMRGEH